MNNYQTVVGRLWESYTASGTDLTNDEEDQRVDCVIMEKGSTGDDVLGTGDPY